MANLQLTNDSLFGIRVQAGTGATQYALMSSGYESANDPSDGYYFALTDLSLTPVKQMESLPPELNSNALPAGNFATGAWMEGTVSMVPRLDNRFGWLLLCQMGSVSTMEDTSMDDFEAGTPGATADVTAHMFTFDRTNGQYFVPWFSAWRQLPHSTTTSRVLEKFQDAHMRSMTITVMAGAPVQVDMDMIGRLFQTDWVWSNPDPALSATYDGLENFAITSCSGYVKIDGTEYKVQSVSVTLTNQLLAPNQSIPIGTMHPIDFPCLGRGIQIVANFLIDDYSIYLKTFGGSTAALASGVNVSCSDYQGDIDIRILSKELIGATAEYYGMRLVSSGSDNVSWGIRPLRVQPNRPVLMQLIGSVQAHATAHPFKIYLQNDTADYDVT